MSDRTGDRAFLCLATASERVLFPRPVCGFRWSGTEWQLLRKARGSDAPALIGRSAQAPLTLSGALLHSGESRFGAQVVAVFGQ
jgi:hypothetical protein